MKCDMRRLVVLTGRDPSPGAVGSPGALADDATSTPIRLQAGERDRAGVDLLSGESIYSDTHVYFPDGWNSAEKSMSVMST